MSKIIINGKSNGSLKAYKGGDEIAAMCAGDSVVYRKMDTGTQPEPPAEPSYLCFTAEQAGSTVSMMNYRTDVSIDTPVLYYSREKVMWVQWDYSPITLSNVGDKVYFYGNNDRIGIDRSNYSSFQMSGRIAASGDVTTLLTKYGTTQLTKLYCFAHLFDGCTSLTTAPELPVTTFGQFASNCYDSMFKGCTSLTTAPALPATTVPNQCYIAMFQGCTSLTTAPALPATTLGGKCYQSMFAGCTSLVTAPELPATTIPNGCYQSMFEGCTALTTAPELPATTLNGSSYLWMFRGCTHLASVKCLAEDISAQNCTNQWLDGVSASGTFTKSANMNDWTTGVSGIPSGWTVQYYPEPELPYLCFTAEQANSTVGMKLTGFSFMVSPPQLYKSTDGENWTAWNSGKTFPTITLANKGDRVWLYGNSGYFSKYQTVDNILTFTMTGSIAASGDMTTLLSKDGGVGSIPLLCFDSAFKGCTALTTAPDLPSETLLGRSCAYMFQGCSSLKRIKCLATNVSIFLRQTMGWVDGVAATGTFTKSANASGWSTGNDGIPSGWTVVDAS